MRLLLVIALLSPLVLSGCRKSEQESAPPALPARGAWHAWLVTPGGPLGFGLEFREDTDGTLRAFIKNGTETIEIPQVAQIGETLLLGIDHYDSTMNGVISEDGRSLSGTWKKRRGAEQWTEVPFEARFGVARRFERIETKEKPFAFSGRWRVRFKSDSHDSIGLFEAAGIDTWRGTFMTTTGDYRFLAGTSDGRSLRLSCFDGAHAFLFHAVAAEDDTLNGNFWNWNTWHDTWTARRDAEVELPDAFQQTRWTGKRSLDKLIFPDLDGEARKLSEFLPKGRVGILYIFGSWCPNCHDAGAFLVELQQKFSDHGLNIAGVAFELSGDTERDAEQVRRYARRHRAEWPLVIGGTADKKTATAAFGGVDFIRSYPTLVFFNRDGEAAAVYSGFSGAATGRAHQRLRMKITDLVERLLRTR